MKSKILFILLLMVNCELKNKTNPIECKIGGNMDTIITNYKRKYDPKTGLEVYDFETFNQSKKKSYYSKN